MWSFLYLAGYVGKIDRSPANCDFDSLVRANRAREDDRRAGRLTRGSASTRPAHLRVIRHNDEESCGN